MMGWVLGLGLSGFLYWLSTELIADFNPKKRQRLKKLPHHRGVWILLLVQVGVFAYSVNNLTGLSLVKALLFWAALFLTTLTDFRFMRVVPLITWGYILLFLGTLGVNYGLYHSIEIKWVNLIIPGLAYLTHRLFYQSIGSGDMDILFIPALYFSASNFYLMIILTSIIGAGLGLSLILFKRKTQKHRLPLAPLIWSASIIAFFTGEELVYWYVMSFL